MKGYEHTYGENFAGLNIFHVFFFHYNIEFSSLTQEISHQDCRDFAANLLSLSFYIYIEVKSNSNDAEYEGD